MKKIILSMLLALVGVASYAADVKDARKHTGFTQIVNESGYDIHYYEGDYAVHVMGPQADLKYILTSLANGILTIKHDKAHKFDGKPYIKVYCPKNKLVKYTGKGAGNFIAKTTMNLGDAKFITTGKGGVTLAKVNAKNLDLDCQGAGNIKVTESNVSGKTNKTQKGTGKVTVTQKAADTKTTSTNSTSTKAADTKTTSTKAADTKSNNNQKK